MKFSLKARKSDSLSPPLSRNLQSNLIHGTCSHCINNISLYYPASLFLHFLFRSKTIRYLLCVTALGVTLSLHIFLAQTVYLVVSMS